MFDLSLGLKIGAGVLTVGAGVIDHMKQQKEIQKEISKNVSKEFKKHVSEHGSDYVKNIKKY